MPAPSKKTRPRGLLPDPPDSARTLRREPPPLQQEPSAVTPMDPRDPPGPPPPREPGPLGVEACNQIQALTLEHRARALDEAVRGLLTDPTPGLAAQQQALALARDLVQACEQLKKVIDAG